jgi:ABC-2 type transport system permease protein
MSVVAASRSELTKQFTTAGWWVLGIILVVYVGFVAAILGAALAASTTGVLPGNGPSLPAEGLAPVIYSTGSTIGYVFPLLIGTLLVTTEFRHQTLTVTFLATPRRGVALVGKFVAGAVLGLLYGVLGTIGAVGAGAGILALFGVDTELGSPDTWALIARMLLAYVLWVLVGIGVGAIVRNQVAAIVIVLAFTQFLEPIGRTVATFVDGLDEVLRFLPGAASDALVGESLFAAMQGAGDTAAALEWWLGGLVLLAYAVVLVVIGSFTTWRRDVN